MNKFLMVPSMLLAMAATSHAAQSADDAVTHFRAVDVASPSPAP